MKRRHFPTGITLPPPSVLVLLSNSDPTAIWEASGKLPVFSQRWPAFNGSHSFLRCCVSNHSGEDRGGSRQYSRRSIRESTSDSRSLLLCIRSLLTSVRAPAMRTRRDTRRSPHECAQPCLCLIMSEFALICTVQTRGRGERGGKRGAGHIHTYTHTHRRQNS